MYPYPEALYWTIIEELARPKRSLRVTLLWFGTSQQRAFFNWMTLVDAGIGTLPPS